MEEKPKLGENEIAINNDEDIEKLKEQIKDEVIGENTPNDQQKALFDKAIEEAAMPVTMKDKDFKLGDSELDIRYLNKKNQDQMFFRQGVITIATLRQCMTSLVDITRLLLVIANKLGVEDIVEATDEIIEKIAEKNKALQGFVPENKDNKNNA